MAEEERRQFLRRLDHELKNPLTAMQVALANLSDARTKKDRQESIESVQAQVRRIASLVASLRKLAELEIRDIECASVDLADLLRTAVALAEERPESRSRNVTLSLPVPRTPLCNIRGDGDLLFLALYNVLDNALKFGRPGDSIDVRAFAEEQSIVIQVTDTGPGIPDLEVPHVWEELYRGRAARGIPGSGLGLGLVRTIVERHGGQVSLRSRVGEGTVVTMRFPAQ
jgi:two-component system OmpR family sensor kinase